MTSIFLKLLFYILSLALLSILFYYLSIPNLSYPLPPKDSVQSLEDADTETPERRAYFTNLNREEVITHYQEQLATLTVFGFPITPYRLNYPPEEAYTVIRDQTRSSFLEEIVHPLRQSLYINGFSPKTEKDDIWYKGVHYNQKITVRFVTSPILPRVIIFSLSFVLGIIILRQFIQSISDGVRLIFKK